MIGAALQRRVWVGSSDAPIFPNQYIILVGGPGVGKGLVLKPVTAFIKHHRIHTQSMEDKLKVNIDEFSPEKQQEIRDYIAAIEELKKLKASSRNYIKDDPLLFPVPADSTTYESLVNAHAQSCQYFKTPKELKGKHKEIIPPSGIYSHASLCSILEELSSLFNKDSDKIVKYFLPAWDCGDYTYATKHQGIDKIQNCCLNLMAGTTPGFMKEALHERLITEGFSARTIFVYETTSRFNTFGIPNYSDEQHLCKERILARLLALSKLFGQCTYTVEAYEYLQKYILHDLDKTRVNDSLKLEPYYARMDLHCQKLAMAIHFSDYDTMEIGIESVKKAVGMLRKLEVNMHFALSSAPKQIHGIAAKKVTSFLSRCSEAQSLQQIWNELEGDIRLEELEEVMKFLIDTEKVEKEHKKYRKKITNEGNKNNVT